MPTEINDSLKNFSPKPLDDKYCRFENGVARPYTGISEVLSLINIAYRHEGLTFLINDAGTVREFWFYGGILDENLVARDKALALVASTGLYEDLLDLPVIPAAQVNADWNEDTGIASILNKPTALSAFTNDPGYLSAIIAREGLYGSENIISFGQQIGQTGNPAALTSNREIPLNGNSFQFTDTNNGSVTLFSSGNFRISTPSSSDYPCVIELNATGTASLTVADSNPEWYPHD
jgi:hypothetical protein